MTFYCVGLAPMSFLSPSWVGDGGGLWWPLRIRNGLLQFNVRGLAMVFEIVFVGSAPMSFHRVRGWALAAACGGHLAGRIGEGRFTVHCSRISDGI